MPDFVKGNLELEQFARNGWVFGAFFPEEDPHHTEDLEVKFWRFPAGPTGHLLKTSSTTEFTVILTGTVEAVVGDQKFTVNAGDYVLIHPGTPNNVGHYVNQPATGLTVKSPSDPDAKKVIPCS